MIKIQYLLFLLLSLGFGLTFGQVISITPFPQTEFPIVFNAYYNNIKIVVEGLDCDDINIISENLKVIKETDCIYKIRPLGKKETIPFVVFNVLNNENLMTGYFSVSDSIPLSGLKINGKRKMEIGVVLSMQTDSVFYELDLPDNNNKSIKFSIISFNASIEISGKRIFSEKCIGNKLPENIKEYIGDMRWSDKLILENVIIRDNNGMEYLIPQKIFYVE